MPVVKAGPGQFLLVGRRGVLENRGSAVGAWLMPGTIYVLVPSTKQEATFEFTQETKDGIPLRFKGIIVFRVTDPLAAARLFDFGSGVGLQRVAELLTHICLGELRHAVSHMTMVECVEQRKTTLSGVAETALRTTIHETDQKSDAWGITVEVVQLAQVFIVDSQLRQQLEAEVRNEIKLKSDQSGVLTSEQARRTELESSSRVGEQKLASDKESLRREEELELLQLARRRRLQTENVATERQALVLEQERFRAEMEAEQDRVTSESPVRLFRIANETEALREELELHRLRQQVKALEVEQEMLLPRAEHALRREMLPLEQAPQIVKAASRVLRGTTLSVYGEQAQLVGQLAPVFDVLARAVAQATSGVNLPAPIGDEPA